MEELQVQGDEYQDSREQQGEKYQDLMQEQGSEYEDVRQAQGDEYSEKMKAYADERTEWERNREKAIGGAEGLLKAIFENQGQAFRGSYTSHWIIMGTTMLVMLGIIILLQKRKDALR